MNPSILLTILTVLAAVLLVSSLFVRKASTLKVYTVLQAIFFIVLSSIAILALYGQTFPLPKIFNIEGLRGYFLLILGVLGLGVTLYSGYYLGEYLHHKKKISRYLFFTAIFILSMVAIVMVNEMISFLILWELMSLSSYFLVIHEWEKPDVLEQGSRYFIITHIGFFAILFAFIPIFLSSGSLFFDTWTTTRLSTMTQNIIFILVLIGFGSKAGVFPLHIWLPKAHPIAPSHISALMSGFMVKIPVLFLLLFIQQFFSHNIPLRWGIVLIVLGIISAFIGIFYAIIQTNIKTMLANSTIENIGIIFLDLGIYVLGLHYQQDILITIGIVATLYHIFNHAIVKGTLFLTAGSIIEKTQTADVRKLGGLIKYIPWIAGIFLLGSRSIIGLPPMNIFNSEILSIVGLIQSLKSIDSIFIGILLATIIVLISIVSATALYTFTKNFAGIFLGNIRDNKINVTTLVSLSEKIAFSFLILIISGLAIFPGFIFQIMYRALGWQGINTSIFALRIGDTNYVPGLLFVFLLFVGGISRVIYKKLTKNSVVKEPRNCGYPVISSKTQYSANSFSQPLRRVYAQFFGQKTQILRNTLDTAQSKYYKKDLTSISYKTKYIYRFDVIYQGLIKGFEQLSLRSKKIMNGRLSIYIIYILLVLIILCAIIYRF